MSKTICKIAFISFFVYNLSFADSKVHIDCSIIPWSFTIPKVVVNRDIKSKAKLSVPETNGNVMINVYKKPDHWYVTFKNTDDEESKTQKSKLDSTIPKVGFGLTYFPPWDGLPLDLTCDFTLVD